jgi:hypothetical protein
MDIEEFLALFSSMKVIDNNFTERDVVVSYNLAMMTQVDEIDSSRHIKMQFLEFLEAVARCADIASLPPPSAPLEEWPMAKRISQALVKKIEHMLVVMLLQCQKEFISKYKWPNKNEWGLFIVPKVLPPAAKTFFTHQ